MIIAFTGKKRSGKTTSADYVLDLLPSAVRINFKAAIIKEMYRDYPELLHELSVQYKMGVEELFEKKPPLMRALMKDVGKSRRDKYEYHWVDQWLPEAKKAQKEGFIVIVDDCRHLNEAEAVRECGGIVIRIVRRGQKNDDTHATETEMDEIEPDYTITVDDGEQDVLEEELERVLSTENII